MYSDSKPKTIFFFGAGASKPANIGTTKELVDGFKRFLLQKSEYSLANLLNSIISTLNKDTLDIEDLMTSIDKLSERKKESLVRFYDEKTFTIKKPNLLPRLQDRLKEFIQQTTTAKSDDIKFLEPILSFDKPRQIFSVNYDTVVEQFCNVYKLRYTDGFEYQWNGELFDDNSFEFHLFKIHGSIMWYKTNTNNYVKLPLPPSGKRALIFGEEATPLILYPMQKWEFVEPLLEILLKFKHALENAESVIVVGYSFRDPHILRIFHEAARKNQRLTVFLISPSARTIYEDKLKYYPIEETGQDRIVSMLEDRVVCLQYGFEQILEKLRVTVDRCNATLVMEDEHKQSKRVGHKTEPIELLSRFADVDFLERANRLSSDIDWFEQFATHAVNGRLLVTCFKLFVLSEIQGHSESSKYWLTNFLYGVDSLLTKIRTQIRVHADSVEFISRQNLLGSTISPHFNEIMEFNLRVQRETMPDIISDISHRFYLLLHWLQNTMDKGGLKYNEFIDLINEICLISDIKSTQIEEFKELNKFLKSNFDRIVDEKDEKTMYSLLLKVNDSIVHHILGANSLSAYVKTEYPKYIPKKHVLSKVVWNATK